MLRNDLSQPIRGVDIVVTVGGDGTLLRASHFMDGEIPVLGVNSDPTQSKEVTLVAENKLRIIWRGPELVHMFTGQSLALFPSCRLRISIMSSMQEGALAIYVQPQLRTLSRWVVFVSSSFNNRFHPHKILYKICRWLCSETPDPLIFIVGRLTLASSTPKNLFFFPSLCHAFNCFLIPTSWSKGTGRSSQRSLCSFQSLKDFSEFE